MMQMPSPPERLLVCAAWPYAKSSTYVGQIAGSILPSDIFARYHRMSGHSVLMVSGSDMHGTPITLEADQEGISPGELAMRYHQQILPIWKRLGIEFDIYTSTATENHHRCTQEVFLHLLQQGYIFKDWMDAPYCGNDRRFLPDRYVEGTCPYCSFGAARGDQCENCGRMLDPAQLLDPRCRRCGHSGIEMRETEHFYLDLPAFADTLREWLQTSKEHWRPNTLNFALHWLQEGLVPRAITRDIDWGVPVPLAGYEDKRFYVWFDAVIGYYSASVEWAESRTDPDAWRQWWQPGAESRGSSSHAYYFVGKDNIAFHTIFWPAILLGLGDMALPFDVPASEFMTMGGNKSIATRGDVVWTKDVLDRYDADSLRFYLASVLPEQRDSNFSYQDLVRHNNDELVAAYGNAVHRVLTFLRRHYNGTVPAPGQFSSRDTAMLAEIQQSFVTVGQAISRVHLREGLKAAMALARSANRYLDEQAPWKRISTDPAMTATTIYVMLQVLNSMKALFAPYLPFSSQKLHELLGYSGDVSQCRWEAATLPHGRALPAPTPLFRKLDPPLASDG
jgi:methionyl-tRNA synthetase